MIQKRSWTALAGVAVLALAATPAFAEEEPEPTEPMESMADMTFGVTGVEYAYTGIPTTLPVGSVLTFTNEGVEFHELIVVHIPDTTTESLEELLAMEGEGRDPMAEGLIEVVGEGPLFADPGETSEGTLTLEREGRHVALCFIPQGFEPEVLMGLGVTEDMPEEEWPPEAQAIMANPPHLAAGMIQEFVVTAGDEPGAEA